MFAASDDEELAGEDYDGYTSIQERLKEKAEELKERQERALRAAMPSGHTPVLLHTSMEFMFPKEMQQEEANSRSPVATFGGSYIDATFGRGGFCREILTRLGEGAHLYAFDVDPTAAEEARRFEREHDQFTFVNLPFSQMFKALRGTPIHGVVFDVGVSSPQIQTLSRGFSLQNLLDGPDRPLDLRMNPDAGVSAAEWLQGASVEELSWVLREYGSRDDEIVLHERVAQAILDEQERSGPYASMKDFATVVVRARAAHDGHDEDYHPTRGVDHPARLTLQALRLFINAELEEIDQGLQAAFKLLVPGGRCVVSIFKNKEAEIVRRFMLEHEEPGAATVKRLKGRRLAELYPLVATDKDFAVQMIGKPVKSQPNEVNSNRRARSAVVYVLEKVPRTVKKLKAKPRREGLRFVEPPRPWRAEFDD